MIKSETFTPAEEYPYLVKGKGWVALAVGPQKTVVLDGLCKDKNLGEGDTWQMGDDIFGQTRTQYLSGKLVESSLSCAKYMCYSESYIVKNISNKQYPLLLKRDNSTAIYLFNSVGVGVCLMGSETDSFGDYNEDMIMDDFSYLPEGFSITLRNRRKALGVEFSNKFLYDANGVYEGK